MTKENPFEKTKIKLMFPLYQYVQVSVWCEECSTANHPIMCTQLDGLYYLCPLCKKQVMVMAEIKTNVATHYGNSCKRCLELEKKQIVFGEKK